MYNPQKMEAMKRLQEEFKGLNRNPMQNFGITVGLFDDDNLFEWKCTILGPKDTCYKGGLFYLKITFPDDYPNTKPEIVFLTPIYHLNVKFYAGGSQPLGHICVSTLNYWKKEYSINKYYPNFFIYLVKIIQKVLMIILIIVEEMNMFIIKHYLKKKLNILLKNMLVLLQPKNNILIGILLIINNKNYLLN